MKLPDVLVICSLCRGRNAIPISSVTIVLSSIGSPMSVAYPCSLCARWDMTAATLGVLSPLLTRKGYAVADFRDFPCRYADPVESGHGLRVDDALIDGACDAMAASIDTVIDGLLTPRGQQ